MRSVLPVALASVLVVCPALAANPKLEEARRLVEDLDLEKAAKVLDAAERTEGNSRAEVLEILALQGIAYGTLGKNAKAHDAFRELLLLEPGYKLPADQPPRVRTPFFEAKDWALENGPLNATPSAEVKNGEVRAVAVTMSKDILRLARGVRFHLRVDGAERSEEVALVGSRAEAKAGGPRVSWWYEVLGTHQRVLLEGGSATAPREESADGALASGETAGVSGAAPPSSGWLRPTGWGLLGAGVVAGGVGVVFGLMANGARSTVLNAEKNANGLVTGLTQREAAALEQQARTNATLANVLWGVGGALAATGVVFILLGGGDGAPASSGPEVSIAPGPGGVSVWGRF